MRVATANSIIDQMAEKYRSWTLTSHDEQGNARDDGERKGGGYRPWSTLDENTRDAWRRSFLVSWDILVEQFGIWIRAQYCADGNDLSALEQQLHADMALDRVVEVAPTTENRL
jgi:hypothetical protein